MRNNTGIFNSRAYINEYARSLRTCPPPAPKASCIIPLCKMLLNLMGEEKYLEWIDTTPDDNEGFEQAAIQKLKELTIG